MGYDDRVTVNDWELARALGSEVLVGKAFAFIGRQALASPKLAWVTGLLGQATPRPLTLSLLGPQPVGLPGGQVAPLALPRLRLAGITSDKALYREGRDEVRLLALDAFAPNTEATLEVRCAGSDFARVPLRLGAQGAAATTLRDLPAGDYEVRFRGAPGDEPACAFTVAEYRLAPLVASLVQRLLEGEPPKLRVKLRLEAFGVLVEGPVRLELTESGRHVAEVRADARGGVVEASFPLEGEGPHAINVQLAADPSRTATVPIVGSRASERSRTLFSPLGAEVHGCLLPAEGAVAVRGIFLEAGAQRATPFRLERVDTRKARLIAAKHVEAVRVVVVDPTAPTPNPGAILVGAGGTPPPRDPEYNRGAKLFEQGSFEQARELFEARRAALSPPHPNYAYFIACCHARKGEKAAAVSWLRRSIEEGWTDRAHLAADEDLAALRGYAPYEALTTTGRREVVMDEVPARGVVEVDCPGPVALVAIGCFVSGKPWEGWAAVVTPEDLAPRVLVPERCAPGDDVALELDSGRRGSDALAFVIVKDARLLSPDTPANRLAGQAKAYVESASACFAVGPVTSALNTCAAPPAPPRDWETGVMRAMPSMAAGAAPRYAAAAAPPGMEDTALCFQESAAGEVCPDAAESGPAAGGVSLEEPEVLFAGLVEAKDGRAALRVRLGPGFADYVAEAFFLAGLDWAMAEGRFRAVKDPFASLSLPAFCHPEDGAIGRVQAGAASGRMRIRVTRDGAEVPLLHDGRAFAPGEELHEPMAEVAFLAGPGDYEAVVEDAGSGGTDRVARRVAAPGKLRHRVKTLRFLEPGQRLSRDADATILSLAVLPGLDKPFSVLVDATADYGHACCEQTAAKLMAACAMYALANGDDGRRVRAEAILLAGVRREASMWLRGRGFKMYPESSAEPNAYYGPKAARYLRNLAMLRETPAGGAGAAGPSRALAEAIDQGLAMAEDASKAYKLEWPPRNATTCEEGYAAVRFGKDARAREAALALARKQAAAATAVVGGEKARARPAAGLPPYAQGAVFERAESAFAAAALLRGGSGGDRGIALALTNRVVKDLGPEGRLYSTLDSVAAIALLSELRAARIVGGAGKVEVDGRTLSVAEAVAQPGGIRSVGAVEGVAAIEVVREVLEDWDALAVSAPVVVSLEKGGRACRRFVVGESVDLRVRLEQGYQDGDLAWVCLPDALTRVVGGGQVKRFSIDFAGRSEVVVSLAATGVTVDARGAAGPQRFAACVRNMFAEERSGNPGLIEVTVTAGGDGVGGSPGGGSSAVARVLSGLRRLVRGS